MGHDHDVLHGSRQRLARTGNRIAWQKRRLAEATDPSAIVVYRVYLAMLEDTRSAMTTAHTVLVSITRRQAGI